MSTPHLPWPPTRGASPNHVATLNLLLGERGAPDRRLPRALAISYVGHAVLLALLVGTSLGPERTLGYQAGPRLDVMPVYGVEPPAAPGPRAAPKAVPQEVETTSKPEPQRPEPVPEAKTAEVWKEATPTPRRASPRKSKPTPRPRPQHTVRPAATPAPDESAAPGGGGTAIQPSSGPPGSPLGIIGGSPDGGFRGLVFYNRWYVTRIQDIVYSNWGNPFIGQDRPAQKLTTQIRFRIHRDGSVTDVAVVQTSGNERYDLASLRAVEHSRLPPLPPDYPGRAVSVTYIFSN